MFVMTGPGNRLREICDNRISNKLFESYAEIARAAKLTPGAFNRYFGRDSIPARAAGRLASVLGVDANYLLYGNGGTQINEDLLKVCIIAAEMGSKQRSPEDKADWIVEGYNRFKDTEAAKKGELTPEILRVALTPGTNVLKNKDNKSIAN